MEAEEAVFGWAFLFFTPFGNDLLRRSDRNDLVEEAVLLLRRNDLELPIKKAGDRMAANISPVVFNHSGGDTGSREHKDKHILPTSEPPCLMNCEVRVHTAVCLVVEAHHDLVNCRGPRGRIP